MEVVADHEVRSEREGGGIDQGSAHRRHGFRRGLIAAYLFLRLPIFKWISEKLIKKAHGSDLLGFAGRRVVVVVVVGVVVVKLLVFVTGSE